MNFERLTLSFLLFCIADIYMLYRFFDSMFQKRLVGKKRIFWFIFIVAIEFLENSCGLTFLNLIFLPVLCYIYSIVQFRVSIRNGIIYTLIFYVIFAGGEVSFFISQRYLAECELFPIISWEMNQRKLAVFFDYIFRFLFLKFIERFLRKIEIDRDNSFAWYLTIVPVITLLVLCVFVYMDSPKQVMIKLLVAIGVILLYFSNAVLFIILEKYMLVLNEVKNEELFHIQQKLKGESLKSIMQINEDYRCYLHDLHAYLRSIRMLAINNKGSEIVNLINEMEGGLKAETAVRVYGESDVFNALLAEKEMCAKQLQIQFHVFVEKFLDLKFIADADKISMFGNLLDNAIEAASKCTNADKVVDVKCFMGNDHILVMQVENTFEVPIKKDGAKILTTKADRLNHGLGIGIVKKLAEKYGGSLSQNAEGCRFVSTLTVSTYDEEKNRFCH